MKLIKVNRGDYNNIDLIRVCMAILVVATHTAFFSFIKSPKIYDAIFTALSVKVPFFFVASGFLVWNKVSCASPEDRLCRVKKWIGKTLRLYAIWTLIYLPLTIYGFYLDGVGIEKSIAVFMRNVIFVGENFYSWQLWYLLGMLVAGVILYFMLKLKFSHIVMCTIAIILAVSGVLIDYCNIHNLCPNLCGLYYKIFDSTRNGFFEGFPYIMIGVTIATYGVPHSKKLLWIIFVLSFIVHMLGLKLATFVMTYALFSLVAQVDLKERQDNLYKQMRLTSTVIYLIHMLWVGLFTFVFPVNNPILLFVIVVLASFGSACIAIKYKDAHIVRILVR